MPPTDPELQMNPYPLNDLFLIIQSLAIDEIYVNLTDHGGEFGVYLLFRNLNDPNLFARIDPHDIKLMLSPELVHEPGLS